MLADCFISYNLNLTILSLYLARSKQRNKKKSKRSGNIARSPLFPAIIERVAEEQKETLESENLPESPLTPLYCTISRKAPVMWPVFLGDWAYIEDEALQQGKHFQNIFIGNELMLVL